MKKNNSVPKNLINTTESEHSKSKFFMKVKSLKNHSEKPHGYDSSEQNLFNSQEGHRPVSIFNT